MTQFNTLNVKFSNSQFNKSTSRTNNGTEVTLYLSSSLIRNSNDETNIPHKLLLTDTQVSKIWKAFVNGWLGNKNFQKFNCLRCSQE